MCQIIHRLKGSPAISDSIISAASSSNRDGWGIMFSSNNKIEIHKSLDMKELPGVIRDAEKADISFVAHLRLGTHGTGSLDNTHPFTFFDGDYALMHNGIFNVPYSTTEKKSDTVLFVEHLETFPKDIFKIKEWVAYLHSLMVSSGNKLAIMAKDGSVYRYGTWYALPEAHTEHEKYKNTLRFSTSPSAVCYDPSKKIKYGYGDGASGWNYDESGRYSFSSKNGALSEDDEKYLDQYEGYANKDGVGSTVYDIGGTHYTLDDLVYLELRDIQTIVESDPDGASVLLKDLIEHASIYSQ